MKLVNASSSDLMTNLQHYVGYVTVKKNIGAPGLMVLWSYD